MKNFKILMLLICMTLLLGGCKKKEPVKEPKEEEVKLPQQTVEKPVDTHEGQVRSLLTGQWVDEAIAKKRPIAIMLSNVKIAIPQSGIENADVVYEAPVEGGITRLMGIFENLQGLEKIGSVRSCRNYFIDFFMGFDAIYSHFGQAVYAVPVLDSEGVDNLNGLDNIGDTVYYRTSDRKSPHNAYTSAEKLEAGIEKMGFRREYKDGYSGQFKFNSDDKKEIDIQGIDAKYVQPGYFIDKPWFEYNQKDKLYYRNQYGGPQIDEATKKQLTYKNIILQYAQWEYYDKNGYLNINTSSGGKGKYITNGKAMDITWKKENQFGPTTFMDSNGKELVINQGKTWVCVILDTYEERINISNELIEYND